MEMRELLESKENLVSFLKSQGFKEESSYKDREYKGVVFLKIGEKKLLAVCEAFSEEKIKEIKNHFLIDRGLTHVAIFFRDKIIFYRNYGDRRYFIYSKRTADNISKINKLKKIGENFDAIFQTKDISGTFYEQFKLKRDLLVRSIKNDIEPVKKYLIAQKIFDRIFFIYFLCHKKIVRFDDGRELSGKVFFDILIENGDFIENLRKAFTLFNTPHKNNILKIDNYKIRIPYLNGELFREAEEENNLKISLKKNDWQRIFEFLNSYHWIIESEVEELTEEIEEEEAKILTPEILGHVYERSVVEWELKGFKKEVEEATKGVSERKKKGVYYTPEEITDYICKNTIYPYLLDNLGNKYKDINEFLEKASVSDIKKTLKVLDEIKVLDPACGSGAFLLKAGEVLFYLKTALLTKLSKKPNYYEIKHSIITENLYGVDILEGAIEIAKLRLWLWLVSSYKEEKQIQALPNIEYNLVVGNSLIGWINEKLTQISLTNPTTPEIKGIFKGLIANSIYEKKELQKAKELLEKTNLEGYIEAYYVLYTIYKKAHGERAIHLKEILQTIRDAIYKSINSAFLDYVNKKIAGIEEGKSHREQAKKYKKLKRIGISIEDFEALNPLHWRVDFGHIIKKGGFDIVIGNPPYVSSDTISKRMLPSETLILKKLYTDIIKTGSKPDYYFYFIKRGINITKEYGYFSYILPNRIISNDYAHFVRECLLAKTRLIELIDFEQNIKIFGADNHPCIFISSRDTKDDYEFLSRFVTSSLENLLRIEHSISIKKTLCLRFGLFLNNIEPAKIEILRSLMIMEELGNVCKIREGLRDEKCIGKEKINNLKVSNKFVVLKEVRGKNIGRFSLKDFNSFFLMPKNKIKTEKINNYQRQLKKKLLIKELSKMLETTYDNNNHVAYGGVYFISQDGINKIRLKQLLLILNSSLFSNIYKMLFSAGSWHKSLKFRSTYLGKLPIPLPIPQYFIKLSDVLLFLNQYNYDNFKSKNQENKELEEKISFFGELANCLVYELYLKKKLRTNLIKLVENKLKDVDYDNWIKLEFKDDLTPAEKKNKEEIEKKSLGIIDKMFNKLKNSKEIENEIKKIKNHEWVRIIEGR
ncbi:MAG: hypothetical protein DRP72_00470 [Candidatus Omnitrophota bacterium]|nr:MAG: hypothetical protein DRP72_00470 [Candidatus Omnitrophota bacterium]